ncbi:hypothetical protein RYX36_021653 [Vicia faba]
MNINNKKKLISIEDVIESVGLGYDLTNDLKLKSCKFGSRLIAFDYRDLQTVQLPGLVSIPHVPKSINCDKGDYMSLSSDVLSFQPMLEKFNWKVSLLGKFLMGHFNYANLEKRCVQYRESCI